MLQAQVTFAVVLLCIWPCPRPDTHAMSWWLHNQLWHRCAHRHNFLLARCGGCSSIAASSDLGALLWGAADGSQVLRPCPALLAAVLVHRLFKDGADVLEHRQSSAGPCTCTMCWHQVCFGHLTGCCGWPLPCCRKGGGWWWCICARYNCCMTGLSCAAADLLACSAASLQCSSVLIVQRERRRMQGGAV